MTKHYDSSFLNSPDFRRKHYFMTRPREQFINESDASFESIVDELFEIGFFQTFTLCGEGESLFRGRITPNAKLFDHVREVGCLPSEKVKTQGRCQQKEVSVFYCSDRGETVEAELKPKLGHVLHLAHYRIVGELQVTCIGQIDHVRRSGRGIIGDQVAANHIDEELNSLRDRDYEQYLLALIRDAYLADEFSRDEKGDPSKDYKITNAFSSRLFSKLGIDALIYPSVRSRGGLNFALLPRAMSKLKLEEYRASRTICHLGFDIYGQREQFRTRTFSADGRILPDSDSV